MNKKHQFFSRNVSSCASATRTVTRLQLSTGMRLFSLCVVAAISGCFATTPHIQLQGDDRTAQIERKAPLVWGGATFSRDGKIVATGSADQNTRLWDLANVRQLALLKGHQSLIEHVVYSPNGAIIATANTGGVTAFSSNVTTIWDAVTGKEIKEITSIGGMLSFSPDGRYILGNTYSRGNGTLKLCDIQTGRVVREFNGSYGLISPDGRKIVVVSGLNRALSMVEFAGGSQIWNSALLGISAIAFSPDGKNVVVATKLFPNKTTDSVSSLVVLDAQTGQQIRRFGQSGYISSSSGSLFSRVETSFQNREITALAISPDGRFILSGDGSNQYSLWDLAKGTLLKQLTVEGNLGRPSRSLTSFSPDGKSVAVVSGASVKLLDVATGKELATMIGFEDGEWLITTPSGYYNSSENGDQYLRITVGGKPYAVSQLRESFLRPDLVKAVLSGRTLGDLRQIADIKPPPSVTIIETPSSVNIDEATVKVKVADQGGGVGDVRVYLNGSAVSLERRNLAVAAVAGKSQVFSYKVRLVSGKNAIRAIAFNAENSMQSTDALHEIEAKIAAQKPSLYAVVVGIQEYVNPKLTLKYSVADANLFADSLKGKATGLFEKVEVVKLVTAKDTTNTSITNTLKAVRAKVRPDDLFVFYVASHGTVDEGEYFLVTSNVGSTSTEKLKRDALSQNSLKELIANIPATKKLIVLDTCNAGKLGDTLQVALLTRGMNEDTAFKILSRAVGSTILSAATSQQEALEGYQNHGLFTWVLAEGLNGAADLDKDGFIKTIELASYVDDKVPELAEKVFRHKQFPVVAPSGQAFPVVRVR